MGFYVFRLESNFRDFLHIFGIFLSFFPINSNSRDFSDLYFLAIFGIFLIFKYFLAFKVLKFKGFFVRSFFDQITSSSFKMSYYSGLTEMKGSS